MVICSYSHLDVVQTHTVTVDTVTLSQSPLQAVNKVKIIINNNPQHNDYTITK